jgi:hypothetical protein
MKWQCTTHKGNVHSHGGASLIGTLSRQWWCCAQHVGRIARTEGAEPGDLEIGPDLPQEVRCQERVAAAIVDFIDPHISWPPFTSLPRDEPAGDAEGVFVPLLTGRHGGAIAGLAVTCNAMGRQPWATAIGQVRRILPGSTGGLAPASQPAARTSFAIS